MREACLSVKLSLDDTRQGDVHQRSHAIGEFIGGRMKTTASLKKKVVKAVQTSMRIEGCKPVQSADVLARAKALMEQQRVQVSVPGK